MSKVTKSCVLALTSSTLLACNTGFESPTDEAGAVSSSYAPLVTAPASSRIPGRYLIELAENPEAPGIQSMVDRIATASDGSTVRRTYSVVPAMSAELSPTMLETLRRDPRVLRIEEDQWVSLDTFHVSPADGIDRVDQRTGRDGFYNDYFVTGQGVHLYIIDTGIFAGHSEFTGRVGNGFDFVDNDHDPDDCTGHGTHVASTAAGSTFGIARGATLHGVRVLGCGGNGTFEDVIAGVNFVVDDCEHRPYRCIANMSLSGGVSELLNDAVDNAVLRGIPVVAAAGNNNGNTCFRSPASADFATTVAATDDNDRRAGFSNWGVCVDIFAPGVTILGAFIGDPNATRELDGTSMAAPHVAGVLAQYLQLNPHATREQIENDLAHAASRNCVTNPRGAPNLFLFSDVNTAASEPAFDCLAPPPGATCRGFCGGLSDFGCFCDDNCEQLGDCCPDKVEVCGPAAP